ncbi:MAG: menaquinone biosynthesis protein [Planctomycetota bacterium]
MSRTRLAVGSVPYLVGRPLDLGLEHEPGLEFRREVPALLVDGLRNGALDVALVSSIELFRRPGYRYLDRFAVAGRGFVGSVQVFLRRPIEDVRSIAMDPASRTAQALVRTLLHDRPASATQPGGAPEFIEVPRGTDPRMIEADAWLRIGDEALRETVGEALPAWNPSLEWTRRTGLPFVFAAWIVAPRADVAPHLSAFRAAHERGAAAKRALADEAALAWRLPVAACREYLEVECLYEPAGELRAALRAFRDGAARAGICDGALDPGPIELG